MKAGHIRMALVTALLLMGCFGQPELWVSHPEKEISGNPFYRVHLTPLKETEKYYVKFRFEFVNLTAKPLFIDWRRSYYIFDNSTLNHFMFKGITRELALTGNLPEDRIEPGATLSRDIFPLDRLTPVESDASDSKSFKPGLLPEGENGIYLTVRQNNRLFRGKIAVQIEGK